MTDSGPASGEDLVGECVRLLEEGLRQRWVAWRVEPANLSVHEVQGGLLARMVTLARELGQNPGVWNPHVAPLLLRSMTDAYITMAWVFEQPLERSREYVKYGLGQEKLEIEHLKQAAEAGGEDAPAKALVEYREAWLSSQRFPWLTEVNVGAMGDTNTRAMAEVAGCLDLYRLAYQPFSASVHNTWAHVGRFNVRFCSAELHRPHLLPDCPVFDPEPDFFYRALRYVAKAFALFDEKASISVDVPSAVRAFEEGVARLQRRGEGAKGRDKDGA